MTQLILPCAACGQKNRVGADRLADAPRCGACHQVLDRDAPLDVDDATLEGLIEHSALPLLVDFWAPWCGPCRMVAPELAKVAQRRRGQALVVKLNTDENPRAGRRFRISGIPTLVLVKGGQERDRLVGASRAAAIEQLLDRAG